VGEWPLEPEWTRWQSNPGGQARSPAATLTELSRLTEMDHYIITETVFYL